MARSKSSGRWLDEHFKDPYVIQSQKDGYRSRASYKLLELDRKDSLFKPGMTVVDLGAAPGGWSQVAIQRVGSKGRVIASDILPMDSIADVDFLQGDFTEAEVYESLLGLIGERPVDLVISDMAPNMSGNKSVDQPRAMYLVELAVDLAQNVLAPGGSFVSKVFQGEGYETLLKDLRSKFNKLYTRKPDASRARSSEMYLVARGFKG